MSIQDSLNNALGSKISAINLALNAAGILFQKDSVSIYTNNKKGTQVLSGPVKNEKLGGQLLNKAMNMLDLNAVIMDVSVQESSKIPEYPLEDGILMTEHQIQMPVTITLKLVMPHFFYEKIIKELKKYKETSTFLSVHTKGGIYNNMLIQNIPHTETPDNIDRLIFEITFKQCLMIKKTGALTTEEVKTPSDSTTSTGGQKQGTPVTSVGA